MKLLDLFAGSGGFSEGFKKAGFNIKYAIEWDKNIAETYKNNNNNTIVYSDDIREIDKIKIFKNKKIDIVIGGPPCQGFSMSGSRNRKEFIDDERNYLFKHYYNLVKDIKPKIFVMENVKGIMSYNRGKIFEEITNLFNSIKDENGNNYKIYFKIFNAKNFGIPQDRERLIVFGISKEINLNSLIEKTKEKIILNTDINFFKNVSVWDAISDLPNETMNGKIRLEEVETNYQKYLRNKAKYTWNHKKTNHSSKIIERIKKIKINQNYKVLNEKIGSIHSGSYGRLDPKGISKTITTRFDTPSGGKFIHPFKNRTLTAREAARIQSFPDNFKFFGTKSSIQTQIGNAVPPKLSFFIAVLVKEILNEK